MIAPLNDVPGPWFDYKDGTYRLIRNETPVPGSFVKNIALFQRQGDPNAVYMLSADGKGYLPMPLGGLTLPPE